MSQVWRAIMVQRITDLLPPPKGAFRRHWKEAAIAVLCVVLFVTAWILAAIFFSSVLVSCCPAPVVKYVEVPTKVAVPCTLPPPVKLSAATNVVAGCPIGMTCFDVENVARIADRESKLKTWIKEARAACSPVPATSQPASRGTR